MCAGAFAAIKFVLVPTSISIIPIYVISAVSCVLFIENRAIRMLLLPDTGINPEMEALLSSTFIQSPVYGTRCSNFLRLTDTKWQWLEKSQQGEQQGQVVDLHVDLKR